MKLQHDLHITQWYNLVHWVINTVTKKINRKFVFRRNYLVWWKIWYILCVFVTQEDRSFNFSTKWIKNFHAFSLIFLTSRTCVVVHLLIALVPTPRCKSSGEIEFSSFFKSIFTIFSVLLFTVKIAGWMNLLIIKVSNSFNFSYINIVNGGSPRKKSRMAQFHYI